MNIVRYFHYHHVSNFSIRTIVLVQSYTRQHKLPNLSLQNRAARILTNSSFDTPSRLLIDRLGGKTIDQLIAEESKIMVYKSIHEVALQYLRDLLTKNSTSSSYVLRNTAIDLKLPKKISRNGQRCFSHRGAKVWNDLPDKTKQVPSLDAFKKLI